MKKLELNELENIQGTGFWSGFCAGLATAGTVAGLVELAATYGMVAAIPGVGQAAVATGVLAAGACAVTYWVS